MHSADAGLGALCHIYVLYFSLRSQQRVLQIVEPDVVLVPCGNSRNGRDAAVASLELCSSGGDLVCELFFAP